MFKKYKTIKELKKLKKKPVNTEFLASFRNDLKDYMSYHPARQEMRVPKAKPSFVISNLRYALPLIVGVIFLGAGGAAFASQGSLPGETLYPVKILTEDIRTSIAASPESKAELHITFASRRIQEVKEIINEKGVDEGTIEVAYSRLQKDLDEVTAIVEAQTEKGIEVDALAVKLDTLIDSEVNISKNSLKRAIKIRKAALRVEENELRAEITTLKDAGEVEKSERLEVRLRTIDKNRKYIDNKEREIRSFIEQKEETLARSMSDRGRAQRNINRLRQEKLELLKEAREGGVQISDKTFSGLDSLIQRAENEFKAKNFSKVDSLTVTAKGDLGAVESTIEEIGELNVGLEYVLEEDAEQDSDTSAIDAEIDAITGDDESDILLDELLDEYDFDDSSFLNISI